MKLIFILLLLASCSSVGKKVYCHSAEQVGDIEGLKIAKCISVKIELK
jgi:hypothetical protein